MTQFVFEITPSGDGFEIMHPSGEVVAWTMTQTWATLVAQGLEQHVSALVGGDSESLPLPPPTDTEEPIATLPENEQRPSETNGHEQEPTSPIVEHRIDPESVLPELTLGKQKPPAEGETDSAKTVLNLRTVEARCRLKAEAARWAAERKRRLDEVTGHSTEIEVMDRDIIDRAKALDCFLWMSHSSYSLPDDLGLLEDVAGWFEVVADALSLVRQIDGAQKRSRNDRQDSLNLLAEASSGLRTTIERVHSSADDEQAWVFDWLRRATKQSRLFVNFMRATDTPDSTWSELSARIMATINRRQETKANAGLRQSLLQIVRHEAAQIEHTDNGAQDHWRALFSAVDELIGGGLRPNNKELHDLLIPVVDKLPDDQEVSAAFESVLRELDKCLALIPSGELAKTENPTQDVHEVAKLLKGKSVVLIGGSRRSGAYQALVDSFGLKELYWIEPTKHQSVYNFRPYIQRSDVAVVLLAIRWANHSLGEVNTFCDEVKKPFVRLAGGYGVNQVAAQIMAQCSKRLEPKSPN